MKRSILIFGRALLVCIPAAILGAVVCFVVTWTEAIEEYRFK